MIKIHVAASRQYDVILNKGILSMTGMYVKDALGLQDDPITGKLKNKKITVKVKDSASSKISSIKGKLNALGKMHPTPKVTINTSGLHDVEAAKSAINGLHDKSVNVSVNYSQSGKPDKAGQPLMQEAQQMHSQAEILVPKLQEKHLLENWV